MTNVHKGEVAIDVDGTTYTFRYSVDALCRLQGVVKKTLGQIMTSLGSDIDIEVIRAVIWVGLREHHKDITLEQAGEMIPNIDMEKLGEAISAALPKKSTDDRPQRPGQTNGTGPASTSPGAA